MHADQLYDKRVPSYRDVRSVTFSAYLASVRDELPMPLTNPSMSMDFNFLQLISLRG